MSPLPPTSSPHPGGDPVAAVAADQYQAKRGRRHPSPRPSPRPSPKPSFSRMSSAISIPSRNNSASSYSHYGFATYGSLQSTPEGIVPTSHASLPAVPAFSLPDAMVLPPAMTPPPTSSPSGAMAEVMSKGPGLIRRVSRGAQGIPHKFRRSGSSRDKTSGPVIMRRRSDSRTAADTTFDVSDLELDYDQEEALEDYPEPINALGISTSGPSVSSIPDSTVVAPVRNSRLEQGTLFTKVTKKGPKYITLRLDAYSAKVFWDPSRPSKAFYIDDVREIRSGRETKHYRDEFKYSGHHYEGLWITIVYSDTSRSKGKVKAMHLIAQDVSTIELWQRTLDSVSRKRINMMAGLLGTAEKSAKLVWQREMERRFKGSEHLENDETMNLAEVIELCRNLHINCSESMFRAYFDKADNDNTGTLNQKQFLFFVKRLKERKDIKLIYKTLVTPDRPEIDQETFLGFLKKEQGINVDADLDHWTAIFDKFARGSKPRATPTEGGGNGIALPATMSFVAFSAYMTSVANSCFVPASRHLQLNRPLNEYFISSSHNTYLTGRQVIGESSTEAYIAALQKGCRCIEIDCWNGNDQQPIVNHGRTFTSSISFHDTIKVINQYAFCESPYPLILSLEVHCDREQQTRMAEIMVAEFGEKLIRQTIDWEAAILPSPEALRGKILIKVKAAAEELDAKTVAAELGRTRDRSVSSPGARPVHFDNNYFLNSPIPSPPSLSPPEKPYAFWATPRTSTMSTNATVPTPILMSSAEESDSPPATEAEDKKKKKSNTSKITKVLGELGVYTKGVKFSHFTSADAAMYNHVFSIGERTFKKLTEAGSSSKMLLEEHNMRCLMRVYPSFHRVTSTNFEPLSCWRRGVQMAALNWQTYDLGQQLNEAMFTGGDNHTGYVLKPNELRLESPTPVIGHKRSPKRFIKFAVDIISAQQLPRPKGLSADANINPYVEFEMHIAEDAGPNAYGQGGQDASARNGYSGIGEPLRRRTNIVSSNGYNPVFDDKITLTLQTRYPELVFVRWTVWNSRDAQNTERAPLATFTAKLSSLQQGYRHLPLFDSNGEQYLFSTLFCKIEKEDPIVLPDEPGFKTISRRSTDDTDEFAVQPPSRSFFKKLMGRSQNAVARRTRPLDRSFSEPRDMDMDVLNYTTSIER